jgi:hypothetical protein
MYFHINPNRFQIGMKDLVFEYFGDVIDKLPQLADWRVRPLHHELIDYASNDVIYLMKVWYLLLPKIDWNAFSLVRSKNTVLKLYRQPVQKSSDVVFDEILKLIPKRYVTKLDSQNERQIFAKLYNWRKQICIKRDDSVNNFISKKQFSLLLLSKPISREDLIKIIPESLSWSNELMQELFLILANKSIAGEVTLGTELEDKYCEMEIEIPPGVSLPEADIAPENIEYVIPNNLVILDEVLTSDDDDDVCAIEITFENDLSRDECKPEELNFGRLIGHRSGKTLQNFLKRKRNRANRSRRNEERKAQGLDPLIFHRCRGIKRDYGRKAKARRQNQVMKASASDSITKAP